MKRFFLYAIIIGHAALCSSLTADTIKKDPKELLDSQVAMLDHLIEMTERSLEATKEIRELVFNYEQVQAVFLKNQENKEVTVKMIRMAHQLLTKIQQHHLTQQFDADFISELSLFSKIATKKGIPKP